jgi:hypothetical protein
VESNYDEVSDTASTQPTYDRFREPIATLEEIGFRRLAVVEEQTRHALVLLALPIMWAKREQARLRRGLRVAIRSPLMISGDGATIALVFAMGVKFYSQLDDGTIVITGSFDSCIRGSWPERQLHKYGDRRQDLPATYAEHLAHLDEHTGEGRAILRDLGFEAYVSMSVREAA